MFRIKSFSINNYKLINDQTAIELAPFTFLFGENGSGKSSLIEALILFKKNIVNFSKDFSRSGDDIFQLIANSNLGSFEDILNKKSNDKNISYEFIIQDDNPDDGSLENYEEFNSNFYETPVKLRIKLIFSKEITSFGFFEKKGIGKMQLWGWEIEDYKSKFQIRKHADDLSLSLGTFAPGSEIRYFDNYPDFDITETKEYFSQIKDLFIEDPAFVHNMVIYAFKTFDVLNLLTVLNLHHVSIISSHYLENTDFIERAKKNFIDHCNIYIEEDDLLHNNKSVYNIFYLYGFFLDIVFPYCKFAKIVLAETISSLTHLGHFRIEIPNFISLSDRRNSIDEENFFSKIAAILKDSYPDVSIPPKDIGSVERLLNPSITLNEMLNDLQLGEAIRLQETDEIIKVFLMQNDKEVNIANASSGFKQAFPIMLAFAQNLPSDILLIEQPELHLHPKLQSQLLEIMVKYNRGLNIIETHSEHMIRKMQILIAENKIKPSDVKIYYFLKTDAGTKVIELRLDKNGFFIDKWPNGFFDEAAELSYKLMEIIANRNN